MVSEKSTEIRYAQKNPSGEFLPPFPYDPIALTEYTRKNVCKQIKDVPYRKYTAFYGVGAYGGIATAYSVGCNFRCIFCWVDWSRDWPERFGIFYSSEEVYHKLRVVMADRGVRKARISGAEPTLCPEHLCGVLDLVQENVHAFDLFIIETNGIVISQNAELAPQIAQYASHSHKTVGHVRLSIRGGLPKPFSAKTGCQERFLDLPFIAAERLWDAGVSFHVAVVVDPRFTSAFEKETIFERLAAINPMLRTSVEEEYLDPYPHALVRLRAVGRVDITGKTITSTERSIMAHRPQD